MFNLKLIKMKKPILILALAIPMMFSSCKDKDDDDDAPTCTAGLGGNLTIVAFPKHHGADTKPLWAYVKFNTKNFPGADPGLYDLVVAGDTSENHIELENLKCGDYYIYEIAFDTAIQDTVLGGIPYSTSQTTGEILLNVPVTE